MVRILGIESSCDETAAALVTSDRRILAQRIASQDAAHHHRMIGERYAPLAALQMFEEGRRTSVLGVASAGPAAFVRSLILKGGFRDGFAGFTIASFAAHHAFLKHLMLWEKQQK